MIALATSLSPASSTNNALRLRNPTDANASAAFRAAETRYSYESQPSIGLFRFLKLNDCQTSVCLFSAKHDVVTLLEVI